MLRGYADVNVVWGIVEALRRRGMDVVTAQDRGRNEADDAELLAEALAEERVMLTNDADFLILAARHSARGEPFAPIYFWPQRERSVGDAMRRVIREAASEDYATARSRVHFL